MGSISRYSKFNFYVAYIFTNEEPSTGKPKDFTPEAEDEIIWELGSHKLYRPLVNPSKKIMERLNSS